MAPIKEQKSRQECDVYSRVNGWYTPIRSWNKGKKSEWEDRKEYKIEEKK